MLLMTPWTMPSWLLTISKKKIFLILYLFYIYLYSFCTGCTARLQQVVRGCNQPVEELFIFYKNVQQVCQSLMVLASMCLCIDSYKVTCSWLSILWHLHVEMRHSQTSILQCKTWLRTCCLEALCRCSTGSCNACFARLTMCPSITSWHNSFRSTNI